MKQDISPRIERLKHRSKSCCCRYCGGDLNVRQLFFQTDASSRIELYCDSCEKIEYGVEKELYLAAEAYVDATGFNAFPDAVEGERRRQMNIAKASGIASWMLRWLGLTDEEGFTVPVSTSGMNLDAMTTVDDDALEALLKEAEAWANASGLAL